MKIKFGAIVTDGRGKLGGHVFSKNGGGSYMRTKVTPLNPNTARQSAVRALFGAISSGWSTLATADRNSWRAAVADWQTTNIFGDLKKPSGKALYQRLNNQAQVAGYPAIDQAPAKIDMPEDAITAVAVAITGASITLTGLDTAFAGKVEVKATPQLSAGTKFVKNKLRVLDYQDANAYTGTDVYSAYVADNGAPTVNSNIYFGVRYIGSNGQASPLQIIKGTVSA